MNMIVAASSKQPCHCGLETNHFSSGSWKAASSWLHHGVKRRAWLLWWKWMISWTPPPCCFLIFPPCPWPLLQQQQQQQCLLHASVAENRADSSQRVPDSNFWKCIPPARPYLLWSHPWLKVSRCVHQCKRFIIKVQSANMRAASSGSPAPPFQLPLISWKLPVFVAFVTLLSQLPLWFLCNIPIWLKLDFTLR